MPFEDGADLVEFDPEAAHLDLVVGPAEVLKLALTVPPGQVPCPVQPLVWSAVRVGDEPFRGQCRPAHIAVCELYAAEVQLTGQPGWYRAQPAVQDAHVGVEHRSADRCRARVGGELGDVVAGDLNRCFGRPVEVEQFRLVEHLAGSDGRGHGECFPGEGHQAHVRECPRFDSRVQERLQHRRHEMHTRDVLSAQHFGDVARVPVCVVTGDHDCRTDDQREEELRYRHVERERCLQ
nr:hypothetical protein [Frankia sp. Mgl5]